MNKFTKYLSKMFSDNKSVSSKRIFGAYLLFFGSGSFWPLTVLDHTHYITPDIYKTGVHFLISMVVLGVGCFGVSAAKEGIQAVVNYIKK